MIKLEKKIYQESIRIWKDEQNTHGRNNHILYYIVNKPVNIDTFAKTFPFVIAKHKTIINYTHRVDFIYSIQMLHYVLKRWLGKGGVTPNNEANKYMSYFFSLENRNEVITEIVSELEVLLRALRDNIGRHFIVTGYNIYR